MPHDVPASAKLMLMVIYWILSIEKGRQSYLEQTYHGSCFSLPTVTRRNPIVQRLSGPLFKCASRRKAAQRYNVTLSSDLNAGGSAYQCSNPTWQIIGACPAPRRCMLQSRIRDQETIQGQVTHIHVLTMP
ncbi:hypothetical protein ARMGADRAFT_1040322 [Armillaria gallica]|uniref:Uncharacterized protein n=1 Tax=Armillaria gallica TaxID=47427 RepID=A0A2H3CTH5_ARMGA|nr:hypothetical protein ARMGADRAFT_1040322 [Armillaria gallica]